MKSSDTKAELERTLTDWSIVLYPEIYKHLDSPEAVFTGLNGIHSIALFGRAKNDLRHNPQTGFCADGHCLVTTPIVEVRDGKFYTENSVCILDKSNKNVDFDAWCEERQHTVPPDGVWSAEEEQSKLVLCHICETCGREELLTSEDGFQQGWDYPPKMGTFKVISPCKCRTCGIDTTLWWEITRNKTPIEELSERHRQTLKRSQTEPESILPESN